MSYVELKNISKSYGKKSNVLENVNLSIQPGEFVVIVGPSGCGKSTLLRMIAGLEEITSGELWIDNRQMNQVPPADRGIAMVFQDYALYPHMNVFENISFSLKIKKLPASEIQNRVNHGVQMLRLEGLLNRKPAELSGGQRQRVAIARAIVKNPKVFLFDEPLSNLDVQLRAQTRIELAELHRRIGSTSIYVTHDQTEAMTLADRIVLLNQGRIQQVGSPLELYRNPVNQFVASFIGSPSMNFLEGEIRETNGNRSFFVAGSKLSLPPNSLPPQTGKMRLGIRPEFIQILTKERVSDKVIEFKVTHLEHFGYDTHLIGQIDHHQIVVRASGQLHDRFNEPTVVGQRLPLFFHPEGMLWFKADGSRFRITSQLQAA
jgi:ABC-type sugar transport system ATPase subunit